MLYCHDSSSYWWTIRVHFDKNTHHLTSMYSRVPQTSNSMWLNKVEQSVYPYVQDLWHSFEWLSFVYSPLLLLKLLLIFRQFSEAVKSVFVRSFSKKQLGVKIQKDVFKSHNIFYPVSLPSKTNSSLIGIFTIWKKIHSDTVYAKRNLLLKYPFSSSKMYFEMPARNFQAA